MDLVCRMTLFERGNGNQVLIGSFFDGPRVFLIVNSNLSNLSILRLVVKTFVQMV